MQGSKKTKLSQTLSPSKEMGNWTERNFSKEEFQLGKKHMKKFLTIPGHNGNANQNHIKIPPHSC
jgi:hypothetical protein